MPNGFQNADDYNTNEDAMNGGCSLYITPILDFRLLSREVIGNANSDN